MAILALAARYVGRVLGGACTRWPFGHTALGQKCPQQIPRRAHVWHSLASAPKVLVAVGAWLSILAPTATSAFVALVAGR